MPANPISRARLFGSIATVVTTLTAIIMASLSVGPSGLIWAGVIATVALGYALWSFILHVRHPKAADAAWDEQNTIAHRDSLIFGFWAVLWVFIAFLGLSVTGHMDPAVAFYWLGPVLGAVPPAHYVVSVLRGRAE
ncbi:hypothetical protein [Roseobacter sp. CCS2]|uniref:hypothetical protein n=1 Tax=Roseobacter sp. CCS2 TaxID=391593 RepID=UPI0000F403C9|nr:hypothetical protein [Roseobacter sp. CCS2]EBA13528.1 hypothetical protein RCCS2_06564 [Roseobacter sp. CCS2]